MSGKKITIEHSKEYLGIKKYIKIQILRFVVRLFIIIFGTFIARIILEISLNSINYDKGLSKIRSIFIIGMIILLISIWSETTKSIKKDFLNYRNIVGKNLIFILGAIGILIIGLLSLRKHNYNECLVEKKIKYYHDINNYKKCTEKNGKDYKLCRFPINFELLCIAPPF